LTFRTTFSLYRRRILVTAWCVVLGLFAARAPAVLAFDHSYADYAFVLSEYVKDGSVDYSSLCANRAVLDKFLGGAADLSFAEYQTFTRNQQLAFMINLYNAAALALVCNHPGMKSVDELKGFFRDAWSVKFVYVFKRKVSLSQLLHTVIRSEFKDPRIHFAVVTDCRSDPWLLSVPYRAESLSQQLDEQMRHFMTARPDVNYYRDGVLYLSPMFNWYAVDFGNREKVLRFASEYFPEVSDNTSLRYSRFDWSLNSQ
jgi:hypothetical protein